MTGMNAASFRKRVRSLVRALGVLDQDHTPCGVPLSLREAYALEAIASAEDARTPFSQSDLQAALGVDKSNVTRLVQDLVSAGRVEQRAAESDGRVRLLRLSAKGRRLARTLDEQSLRRFERIWAHVPASEREGVARALEIFRGALEAVAAGSES